MEIGRRNVVKSIENKKKENENEDEMSFVRN